MTSPRRLVRIAVALVLVALAGWGGWVWSHPTLLGHSSGAGNARFAPSPVADAAYYVGVAGALVNGPTETVTIHAVEPHFAVNTAEVKTSFLICRSRTSRLAVGATLVVHGLDDECTSLKPLKAGSRMRLQPDTGFDQIVMKLVASKAGEAHVDEVSISYGRGARHLWQRGTEVSEQDWRITAQ